MLYQRVTLATATVDGQAGALPPELIGLDDATLADLPAALDPVPDAFAGVGYWPIELSDPTYDPATEILTDGVTNRSAVNSRKVVTAKRTKRALTAEELAERNPVPLAVTPLQMRKALRAAGLKAQADAYLGTLSEEAQEAWEYCVEVRIDDAFIADAAAALGMTPGQRDNLFRLAASL